MKNFAAIEKRLAAIEKNKNQHETCYVLYCPSRANSTAYYLSNGMHGDPRVVELHWSEKPPTYDAFKLRWLGQYDPDKVAEFRAGWERSPWERDRIALKELDRLLALAGGADAVRRAFLRLGRDA